MRLKEIHRAADEAGRKAADNCLFTTPKEMGFAFIKFTGNTPWGLWTKKQGLSIKTSKRGAGMMIRQYDSSMPKKIAYTHAYADFLIAKGIQVEVKIDRGQNDD